LTAFVDYYKNSLKSLKLEFYSEYMSDLSDEWITVLSVISQMKAIRELSLVMTIENLDAIQSIVDYHCEVFVNQWPQLKRYRLHMCHLSEKQMKQLPRLDLVLNPSTEIMGHKLDLTSKSLSPLKRLTHFELDIKNYVMNETFFDSIHTHLPHIQSLMVTELKITPTIEAMLKMLPKLKCFRYSGYTYPMFAESNVGVVNA